ncbi:16S rRNA (cytosine967-C5)-methyltransferase [Eubacterium ruminantium]|nr:16S rRNA (cytosine967-C5)-methyltransferase [Eubacterium ruminantium]
MAETARDTVLSVLLDIEQKNTFSNIALDKALRRCQFSDKQERAYITRTVEGVTESRLLIDHIIGGFSKTKLKSMRPIIRNVLRMGCFELLFMDSIPARATISECVKIVRKHNMANLTGFTNAILRNISRKTEGELSEGQSIIERLDSLGNIFDIKEEWLKYSTPEWIYDFLKENFGEEKAVLILRDEFNDRGLPVRVNRRKIGREELKEKLIAAGIEAEDGKYSDNILLVRNIDFVRKIPGYKDGLFSVQAESSAASVEAAEIKEGMRILDLCAAPGGKSCYAAEILNGTGEVVSRDISEEKTWIIEENTKRLGLPEVKISAKDATEYEAELEEGFDLVIADVPCSGLGVIGKKNDIKYRVTPEDLKGLSEISMSILDNAVRYVKKGGKLLFSTCTINPGENQSVTEKMLEKYELELIKERSFLQGVDDTDGFYYAVLLKK